jgi:hypothetical protein
MPTAVIETKFSSNRVEISLFLFCHCKGSSVSRWCVGALIGGALIGGALIGGALIVGALIVGAAVSLSCNTKRLRRPDYTSE